MNTARILLVDDELAIRTSLARAMRRLGYTVVEKEDGTAALEELSRTCYDVVVTDLVMEGGTGIQVLEKAKQSDPDTCVILFTGYSDTGSAIEALRLGADDYLPKPFDYDEMLLRVEHCAEKRILRRKVRLFENFLPMCSGCRKVRDDSGVAPGTGPWVPLEVYLERRAGITVSHGFCPVCGEAWRLTGISD